MNASRSQWVRTPPCVYLMQRSFIYLRPPLVKLLHIQAEVFQTRARSTLSPPFLLLSGDGGLQNKNALRSSIADSRDSWDSTFPLHHLARLWSSRVSCLLPELPVQGARVGLSECRPRAGGGALQRWHRTLRDLLSSWHLPRTGSYEALWQRNEWIS